MNSMPDEEELLEEVITMRVKGETEGLGRKRRTVGEHPLDARKQPHDGVARCAPEHLHAGNRRNAGARDLRGGCRLTLSRVLSSKPK